MQISAKIQPILIGNTKMKTILFLLIFLFSLSSQARLFSNSYVSFELPTNWTCAQEGYEHVCINKFSKKEKEAVIILTAKKKGAQDTLPNYEAHLKTPRKMKNYKNIPYSSKVKVVKRRKISGVNWIDGIHLGSEVETYYTRYAATAIDSLGILVTFSAHKDHYSKYSNDFMRAIQTLKVIAPKDLASLGSGSTRGAKRDLFSGGLSDILPEGVYGDLSQEEGSDSGFFAALGSKGIIGILLLLLTALGVFIYMKSR